MYKKEKNLAIELAKKAGEIALSYAGRPMVAEFKDGIKDSPVTKADKEIDALLHKEITTIFPQDGWLSEEIGAKEEWWKKPRIWVVDPIDGTVAYLKWLQNSMPADSSKQGDRQFSISIALVENGSPVLGVVYAPLKEQMIVGIAGQGVWVNGKISNRATPPTNLNEAIYLSSVSETRDNLLGFTKNQFKTKIIASIAYKLALVGVNGKYISASVKPKNLWDVAAGEAICTQAGVKLTDLLGQPINYSAGVTLIEGTISAPISLYSQLKKILPNATTGGYR